jgi:hypothetical protein
MRAGQWPEETDLPRRMVRERRSNGWRHSSKGTSLVRPADTLETVAIGHIRI